MTLSLILGRKYLSVEDGHFEVVTTAWLCIHTSDFPLLVLKISLYVSFHLLSCFMLSGKVAPPELKYLNMCISCDTWEAYAGHGLFVHATGKCGVVILLVCFRFHTGTYSRIFFFFFFPPLYHIYKISCLGKSLTTSGDLVLQSLSESNSFWQSRCLLNAAFIWDCSLRETNKLEVDNGNKERQGGLLVKLQDYFIW